MIRLFTTTFHEGDETRRHEYRSALERNVACGPIREIHLLDEGHNDLAPASDKITKHPVRSRPTYARFFDCVNSMVDDDDISIVANTDIYFDRNIGVIERFLKPTQCFALSRWDLDPAARAVLFNRKDSQDSWIIRGRIRPIHADIPLGVPRCDNRMAHQIEIAGYKLLNPSFSIKSYHIHSGERVEYALGLQDEFVEPPYKFIWPHNLMGYLPRTLYNLSQRELRLGYRLDSRRLRRLTRKLRRLFR